MTRPMMETTNSSFFVSRVEGPEAFLLLISDGQIAGLEPALFGFDRATSVKYVREQGDLKRLDPLPGCRLTSRNE